MPKKLAKLCSDTRSPSLCAFSPSDSLGGDSQGALWRVTSHVPSSSWGCSPAPRGWGWGAEAEVSFQPPGSICQETSSKASVGHGAMWVPDLLLRTSTDPLAAPGSPEGTGLSLLLKTATSQSNIPPSTVGPREEMGQALGQGGVRQGLGPRACCPPSKPLSHCSRRADRAMRREAHSAPCSCPSCLGRG